MKNMPIMKMKPKTGSEILLGLKICMEDDRDLCDLCEECPYNNYDNCHDILMQDAYEHIKMLEFSIRRLYREKDRKTIAVDFDGTLCEEKWPDIGDPRMETIHELKARKDAGDKIILWTCREGKLLDDAVAWCRKYGIEFDAINDNTQEQKEKYGDNPRKISADEYWDDRAKEI